MWRLPAILVLIATSIPVAADEGKEAIQAELEAAKSAYSEGSEKAKSALLSSFDEAITRVSKKGDFNALKTLTAQKEAFDAEGKLPESGAVKSAVSAYIQAVKRQRSVMSAAFQKAIRAHTMALDVDAADTVKADLDAFNAETTAELAIAASTDIEVIAAFYGQNVSWFDVTDKVRHATEGKSKWSAQVRSADWGDPAPGFKGPRTLIIKYSIGGKLAHKSVYEGDTMTVP
jgi:hypothetical protein